MKIRKPLSSLGLVLSASMLVVGCGGSDTNTQAKNPADSVESTTTTTGSQMGPAPNGQDANMQTQVGDTAPAPNPQPATNAMSTPQDQSLSDADIAAITEAANSGEVDQGKLAVKKAKSPKVKKFAQMMVDDHSKAKSDQSTFVSKAQITPSSNTLSRQIGDDGAQALSSLQNDSGSDFDIAYVDLQVNEHRQVLTTLDQKLIPAAQNADFKAMLMKQRDKVAEHLKHAEDLQQQLGGAAAGSTSASTGTNGTMTGTKSTSGTKSTK